MTYEELGLKKVNLVIIGNDDGTVAKDFDYKAGGYSVPGDIFRTGGVTID